LTLFCFSTSMQADITITQLANEGVIISDDETRVMIDGMVVEPYSIYGGLPAEAVPLFDQVSGPFSGIDLALVSHRHHDHNQPRYACDFIQQSADTLLATSPQVLGLMREKCREFITGSPRVREIAPEYGQPVVFSQAGAKVTVFPLSHGTRKYARIQNYGQLLEIGGLTVLHIGDAAMNPADFDQAGLGGVDVDVALIPFWYFQPGPGEEVVRSFMNAPFKIAVHIPPAEMQEVVEHLQENFPDVMVLKNPLDQARFSSSDPRLR